MKILRVKKVTYKADSPEGQKKLNEIYSKIKSYWKDANDRMMRSDYQATGSVSMIIKAIDELWKEWNKLDKQESKH